MSSAVPLVTIGVINYNNERFVIETLESVRAQTYPNIEVIIVDDCSTDNSLHLIREWLKTFDKPAMLIEHPSNQGITAGCNDIYVRASGKYFCFIATDDALLPDKTADQVRILEEYKGEYAMVYGDAVIINEESEVLTEIGWKPRRWQDKDFVPPSGDIFLEIIKDIYFYVQSALIDLEAMRTTGFKFDKNVLADDYDLELMISRHFKVYGSKKEYIKYRRVQSSFSTAYAEPGKIHRLHRSLFQMFLKYLNHPLNTNAENLVLLERIRGVVWNLEQTDQFTNKDRIGSLYRIFGKTHSLKDSYLLLKAVGVYLLRLDRRRIRKIVQQ